MKKPIPFITSMLFLCACISVMAQSSHKDLIGEWKFDVAQAPYEYQKGKMVIEKSGDQLEGKVIFERAQDVTIRDINAEDEEITITLYIQGEKIQVIGKIEENDFVGYVDTYSQDRMDFKAEKIIAEE